VSATPTRTNLRPVSPLVIDDAGPLRLLRRRRQHSTTARVRPSSGANMAEVAVSARSSKRRHMDALQRTLETPSSAFSQDRPRIRRRERISLVKNRMREFRSSGSARDGGGNVPIYSAVNPEAGAGPHRAGLSAATGEVCLKSEEMRENDRLRAQKTAANGPLSAPQTRGRGTANATASAILRNAP